MEAIDTKQMLIDKVERYVSELENLELGKLFITADGDIVDADALGDHFDAEPCDIYDYFEADEPLDVAASIDSDCRIVGFKVWMAFGGPTIVIDTARGEVAGWWGADEVRRYLDSVDAVNEYYTEQFAGSLIKA